MTGLCIAAGSFDTTAAIKRMAVRLACSNQSLGKETPNPSLAIANTWHASMKHMRAPCTFDNGLVCAVSGEIFGGCNVESSSYGLTCCAERVALYHAISKGHNRFRSMAISTENGGMPCGACRQVIWDLCNEIKIHICDSEKELKTIASSKLLPEAFDKSFLE